MRLGFAVKVLGQPNLKSNDTRRWQNNPHLSVSLAYARDIFLYLRRVGIRMYRLSSELAPYFTHPDLAQFHGQIEECRTELAELGRLAQESDIRLSFHPSQYVILSAPNPGVAQKSMADIEAQATMLELMGCDDHAVVVTHVGGAYEDKRSAIDRFVERYWSLSETARRRLVLESDERRYTVDDTLLVHERTGLRLIFDSLHFQSNNPRRQRLRVALESCLATWPDGQTPKAHVSSPRTELRIVRRRDPETGRHRDVPRPPLYSQHSDFINPFEFISFLEQAQGLRPFDVMLEAKAKDLALSRLRRDVKSLAPDLADQFGL